MRGAGEERRGGEVGARAQEGVNGENGEENLVLSRLPGKKEKRDAKLALLLFLLLSLTVTLSCLPQTFVASFKTR